MQKFVDQSISANTAYDPGKFEGNKVSMKQNAQRPAEPPIKYGVKTLYYHNTRDGATIPRLIFRMMVALVGLVRFKVS